MPVELHQRDARKDERKTMTTAADEKGKRDVRGIRDSGLGMLDAEDLKRRWEGIAMARLG